MNQGVFSSLSESYFQASKNGFYFVGNTNWLMKPLALVLAMGFSLFLLPVGIVFWAFIILDHLGGATDGIRKGIINSMENNSYAISHSFGSFIFSPIWLVLTAPLFILSLAIPKVSSDAMLNMAQNEVCEIISGAGAFKRMNKILWNASNNLFVYLRYSPLLLKPFVAIIAIIYSIVLTLLGAFFIIFIPLDWISQIVENIRQGIVRFVDRKQYAISHNTGAFIFTPALLVILAPLFLIAILIPKFTSQIMDT